jgi:hypothetical protein
MATNKRSIGGQGLEQGGANLGNDYNTANNNTNLGGSDVTPVHSVTPEDFDQAEENQQDNNDADVDTNDDHEEE